MENNEIYHHGIIGQKWGVRRYQNSDGTLTDAGKKRYSAEMEKLKKEETILKNKKRTQAKIDRLLKKRQEIDEAKRELHKTRTEAINKIKNAAKGASKPKSIKDMSDEELISRINRLKLEQTLAALTPKEISRGEQFVDKVLKPIGQKAAERTSDMIIEAAKKKFGLDAGDDEMKALKKAAEKAGLNKTIAEANAAIKKANGEGVDSEYEKLKRDADIAGFKQKIAVSETMQRKNKKEADEARAKAEEAAEEFVRRKIQEMEDRNRNQNRNLLPAPRD